MAVLFRLSRALWLFVVCAVVSGRIGVCGSMSMVVNGSRDSVKNYLDDIQR